MGKGSEGVVGEVSRCQPTNTPLTSPFSNSKHTIRSTQISSNPEALSIPIHLPTNTIIRCIILSLSNNGPLHISSRCHTMAKLISISAAKLTHHSSSRHLTITNKSSHSSHIHKLWHNNKLNLNPKASHNLTYPHLCSQNPKSNRSQLLP